MDNSLSDAEKKVFADATARRKANGIRLKRITLLADASQVEAFTTLWEGWIERFGKPKAVDVLLRLMSTVETRMREVDAQKAAQDRP